VSLCSAQQVDECLQGTVKWRESELGAAGRRVIARRSQVVQV
jgi:hypothetical protein